jgi:hypothetical protein
LADAAEWIVNIHCAPRYGKGTLKISVSIPITRTGSSFPAWKLPVTSCRTQKWIPTGRITCRR